MNERHSSAPIDPPQHVYLDRVDRAEPESAAEPVSGNTDVERSPARQGPIKPWRWQVR